MADKFQNKYRIPSARATWWNYGDNGYYFVTICTYNKEHWFGEIENGVMVLSEIGKLTENFWQQIPQHFPFVELYTFVVMPNHVHGIIRINKNHKRNGSNNHPVETTDSGVSKQHPSKNRTIISEIPVSLICDYEMPKSNYNTDNFETPESDTLFPEPPESVVSTDKADLSATEIALKKWQRGCLGVIINQYKRMCTLYARKHKPLFTWQTRYHDRIIRSTDEYSGISHYILTNVENWEEDCFNL